MVDEAERRKLNSLLRKYKSDLIDVLNIELWRKDFMEFEI
jgi:hypothetical protein